MQEPSGRQDRSAEAKEGSESVSRGSRSELTAGASEAIMEPYSAASNRAGPARRGPAQNQPTNEENRKPDQPTAIPAPLPSEAALAAPNGFRQTRRHCPGRQQDAGVVRKAQGGGQLDPLAQDRAKAGGEEPQESARVAWRRPRACPDGDLSQVEESAQSSRKGNVNGSGNAISDRPIEICGPEPEAAPLGLPDDAPVASDG